MRNATLSFFGFSIAEVCARTGMADTTVLRHIKGTRKISPEYAIKYHDALGVPLSDMRPDIWRPTNESSAG